MSITKKDPHPATLHAIFDYLSAELDDAKSTEDLAHLLRITKAILFESPIINMVMGVENVRAELDVSVMAKARNKSVSSVQLEVPSSLGSTFERLSWRMRQLQSQDPKTFADASNALKWLAKGELYTNCGPNNE